MALVVTWNSAAANYIQTKAHFNTPQDRAAAIAYNEAVVVNYAISHPALAGQAAMGEIRRVLHFNGVSTYNLPLVYPYCGAA
jgi:hypothetical protein